MSSARVQNVDALKRFRIALWKFAESANVALGDAEGEASRTLMWLQTEQPQFWNTQIRKRHEKVNQCKDAVRQKKLFKDSTGKTQSAVDEEKALGIAQKRLAEAEQKLLNTKRHASKLQKELHMYKGSVQRFATTVSSDIPNAVATLDRMVQWLESYLALSAGGGTPAWNPPVVEAATVTEGEGASMARADTDAPPTAAQVAAAEEADQKGIAKPQAGNGPDVQP